MAPYFVTSSALPGRKKLAVILCTYNPRRDFLSLALRSIGAQTLDRSLWDFVLVDNNSSPPLNQEDVSLVTGRSAKLIHQPVQGLTHARIAGLKATDSDYVVFVDDDNELAEDYLANVMKIVESQSTLGAFGGISEGVLERPVGKFKRGFLGELGIRNYGDERIEGPGSEWGEWEPIGAGLVVRRSVAQAFVDFVEDSRSAGALGRSGNSLMSGEDSLFSRLAYRQGLQCAYEPTLKLRHYMSGNRLTARYLARLVYGHGRSFVLLSRSLGNEPDRPESSKLKFLAANWWYRGKTESFANAFGMLCWDAGFYDEVCSAKDG